LIDKDTNFVPSGEKDSNAHPFDAASLTF